MKSTSWIYPCDDNCFLLQEAVQSTLRQCFIARWLRSACWRHRVSLRVRHDPSRSPDLSSADHCALDGGEEVVRAPAAEVCLLGRLGSARISRKCVFHVVPDALLMHWSQKGMQDLNALGRGPSKGSNLLLNPEQTQRQSYWNLARVNK